MELIAETYHLLKVYGGMNNGEIRAAFEKWNEGIISSFLVEITIDVLGRKDELTKNDLIDMVLDSARQKGTGTWTSEDAMSLSVPIPVIDAAVTARNLSALKAERVTAQGKTTRPQMQLKVTKTELVNQLEQALYFSMITTYAQGMSLLQYASEKYTYGLKLDKVARIWRGGCIIRAAMLEDIRNVYIKNPELPNLMIDEFAASALNGSQGSIRKVIQQGVEAGIPMPAFMASVAYFDAYHSGWLPANLIQAQRDYFGAHTYERNDREGSFHTAWSQKN
jgi:6-phosphogluconate dehydrogenase